jgi:hypothetical protein
VDHRGPADTSAGVAGSSKPDMLHKSSAEGVLRR